MLAAHNNKNDMQDFQAILKLPAWPYAEIFEGAHKCSFGIFALCECQRHDYFRESRKRILPSKKILQNYTQIYAILVLPRTTFKIIFV